ncbi:MAG: hypothetical protein ABIA62_02980 [Candidatus Woesearchaeota archaeon]
MKEAIPAAIKKDLVRILKKAQRYINSGDSNKLKSISENAIYNLTVYQDEDSLSLAVILYAISKLLERWGFDSEHAEQTRVLLGSAQFSVENDDPLEYREKMKNLFDFISTVEKESKIYVEKVIEKAQIKKGTSIYAQGISIARVADLFGIGQWELLSYIGKTRIHDEPQQKSDVAERLRFARSLFVSK